MVIPQRADRPAHTGFVQEQQQTSHQQCGNGHSGDVFLFKDQQTAPWFKHKAVCGDAQFLGDHDLVFTTKDDLAKADQEQGDADCGHEQDDIRLPDKRAQNHAFNGDRKDQHHHQRQNHADPRRYAHGMQADQCQGGEHHHDTLGKVENPA